MSASKIFSIVIVVVDDNVVFWFSGKFISENTLCNEKILKNKNRNKLLHIYAFDSR